MFNHWYHNVRVRLINCVLIVMFSTAILLVFVRPQRERLCVAGLLLFVCYGLLSLVHFNPYYNK